MRYAQIDPDTGICFAVSDLYGEVNVPHMVLISADEMPLGKRRVNDKWEIDPLNVESPSMPPTEERILQLEAENRLLKSRQAITEGAVNELADIVLGGDR